MPGGASSNTSPEEKIRRSVSFEHDALNSVASTDRLSSKNRDSKTNSKSTKRVMRAQELESTTGPVTSIEDVIEFSSQVYYVKEDDAAFVSVDIVRLGACLGGAMVDFRTADGSAKAGLKYEATAGSLEFVAGERLKSIRVNIISDNAFDTTLEFSLRLENPRGAVLGKYLHKCEVMILDDDSFPTNKFKTLLHAGLASEIPYWPLIKEYLYMHLQEAGMRRAFLSILILDQLSNLKYIWAILLTNYTVDSVLNPPEGTERPDHVDTIMYVITALSMVPHVMTWLLDHIKAYRRINGRAISKLQQNLLRKFLNYDEVSRSLVSTPDLQMAITRDVPELVEATFSSIFGIIRKAGLLAIFVAIQIEKIGSSILFTAGLFLAFPLITSAFLALRQRGTKRRQDEVFQSQTVLVSFIQQVTDCCRLINDYMQRPSMVVLFAEKVGSCNKAILSSKIWNLSSKSFAPMLTSIMVGIFALYTYKNVIDGGPLGEFLTGCAIWKGIGDCYQEIFSDVRELFGSIAPLENIVFYMNLPVDIAENMHRTQHLLEDSRHGLKVAEDQLANRRDEHCPFVIKGTTITTGCFTDDVFFATDLLQISARCVSFAYPKNPGGSGGNRVLDEASFEIPQGKLVAVTGPRGSGKATLLDLIGNVLRPDGSSGGTLFVPPHLRVLNVSSEPQTISDMDLFANLCFGPPDHSDHKPKRVLAICRRLGMSHEIVRLVESHAENFASETSELNKKKALLERSGSGISAANKGNLQRSGTVHSVYSNSGSGAVRTHAGTAYSVTQRRSAELMANDGSVLSQTDRCLLHLARALIANPDVLILHKPLSQLDEYHVRLVLDLLREFIDLRGVEKSAEGRLSRRPKTCIFSVTDSRCANFADKVFHVAQGNVSPVDIQELEMLRNCARKLFEAMDLNCDNLVSRREFIKAVQEVPWASELLDVGHDGTSSDSLGDMFDMLDRSSNGEVDFDELVQYLRTRFDGALPQVLASLHSASMYGSEHHKENMSDMEKTGDRSAALSRSNSWHAVPDRDGNGHPMPPSKTDVWNVPEVAIEVPMFSPGENLHDLHGQEQRLFAAN